jgi:hypothetical protein
MYICIMSGCIASRNSAGPAVRLTTTSAEPTDLPRAWTIMASHNQIPVYPDLDNTGFSVVIHQG